MDDRTRDDIRDVAAALEANVPTSFGERFKRIVKALEEAEGRHIQVSAAPDNETIRALMERELNIAVDKAHSRIAYSVSDEAKKEKE